MRGTNFTFAGFLFAITASLLAGCSPGGSSSGADETAAKTSSLSASAQLGQKVFTDLAQPSCGMCHILKHAKTTGVLGPDLDELRPDREATMTSVRGGVGVMPPQEGVLTEEQIQAVADYIFEVAGR